MIKVSPLAALLVAGFLASAPVLAADKGKAAATVNGQPVSQSEVDTIVAAQVARGVPDSPELRKAIKDRLILNEVVVQEAKKKGFDKNPEVQNRISMARQEILIQAYAADFTRAHPISEDRLKKDYEAYKASLGSTEYKTKHILVANEDEAKAIIAKLDKGEKFSELAKQSKDPGSKDNGGDLGWSPPSAYAKPFSDGLTKLKKGEYTKAPVKTEFGFHVIMLEETRPLTVPSFEQLKPQLQQRAAALQFDEQVKKLRESAKVN